MSKRPVVDFYELPGGVTEAILRRIRLTVFHTGIAMGRVQLGPYADLPLFLWKDVQFDGSTQYHSY